MKFKRFAVAVVVGLTALTTLTPATGVTETCWDWKSGERRMAKKVNKARSNHGRVRLRLDPELSKVAKVHTKRMAKKSTLYHTPNLGDKVTNWTRVGENVGYGDNVGQLHKMFMDSDGHRANILQKSYRYVGVATLRKGGWTWVTVVFEAKKNPGTTYKMPNC